MHLGVSATLLVCGVTLNWISYYWQWSAVGDSRDSRAVGVMSVPRNVRTRRSLSTHTGCFANPSRMACPEHLGPYEMHRKVKKL